MRRARPEAVLQEAACGYLDAVLPAGAWFCAIPNGGWRSKPEAALFKRQGVRAGSPDLLIVHEGRALFIELKSQIGRLSEAQKATILRLHLAGTNVAVCRSLEQIEEALREWGVPLKAQLRAA